MQTQPLEIKDFAGGMTDFYLGGPLNKYERADNLLIVKHGEIGKLFTRPGSEIYNATYYQIPSGAARIGTLKSFNTGFFYHSARKFWYIYSGGWQVLQGSTGNDAFPTGIDTTTVLSMATWNKHLYFTSSDLTQKVQKIYKESAAGAWRLRTAGMPALASSPTITAGTPGATYSYLYRLLYKYTYTVDTVVHVDRGPTLEVTHTALTAIAGGAGNAAVFTLIPAIANSTTYNYDTAGVLLEVEVYRTTNGGQNFFWTSTIPNGTAGLTDNRTDAVLLNQEPLYTEGGAPEQTEPPLCKLVHVVGNRGIYAHTKEGNQVHGNRFYQSLPDDIDSVPADYYAEIDEDITGLSSVKNSPLLLCGTGPVYRVDGFIDELGRGFLDPQKISETAGCVSSSSVVQTHDGIFWAGKDGFYFSDAFNVVRVSEGIRTTYQEFIASDARKRRIVGKYDAVGNRIWWTVQWASAATDCDACFILDLNFGITPDMPFTTASGGTSFNPTAIEFVGANLIRGDTSGYTFIHRDTLYVDPKIDTGVIPSLWSSNTIIYDYLSVATDFGTSFARKWVPGVSVVCKNETNLSLQIRSINDDGRRTGDLKPIRFRGNVTWGDADLYWGDPDLVWNYQGLIDESRRMPAKGLRCEYKQLQLTNAKVAIVSSDVLGTCTVSNAANTAVLTEAVSFDWPTLAIDYVIAFEADGYVKEYTITVRANDTLTFADTDGTAPTATAHGWVIRGYPKGEVLHLLSYTLEYAVFGLSTQAPSRAAGSGEVGAS